MCAICTLEDSVLCSDNMTSASNVKEIDLSKRLLFMIAI